MIIIIIFIIYFALWDLFFSLFRSQCCLFIEHVRIGAIDIYTKTHTLKSTACAKDESTKSFREGKNDLMGVFVVHIKFCDLFE